MDITGQKQADTTYADIPAHCGPRSGMTVTISEIRDRVKLPSTCLISGCGLFYALLLINGVAQSERREETLIKLQALWLVRRPLGELRFALYV